MNNQNTNRKRVHKLRTAIVNLLDIKTLIETQLFHKLKPLILSLAITAPNTAHLESINTCTRDFYNQLNTEYLTQIEHAITRKESKLVSIYTANHRSPYAINSNKNKHLWDRVYEQIELEEPVPVKLIETCARNSHFWYAQQTSNYHYSSHLHIAINAKHSNTNLGFEENSNTGYSNTNRRFEELINVYVKQLATLIVRPLDGERLMRNRFKTDTLTKSSHLFTQITEYIYYIYPQNSEPLKFSQPIKDLLDLGLNYVLPAANTTTDETWSNIFDNFLYRLLWNFQLRAKQTLNFSNFERILPKQLNDNRVKQTPAPNLALQQWCSEFKQACLDNWNTTLYTPDEKTVELCKAIDNLRKNKELIIKMADKGSGIVIMHKSFYREIANKFLQENESVFKLLNSDPTAWIRKKVTDTLWNLKLEGKLNNYLFEILQPATKNKAPNLYFLPKIHKKPNISGRPISSGNGHPAENISVFVDFVLKPYAEASSIFIKDSTVLINDLSKLDSLPSQTILFSLDVVNMYTNIPIDEMMDIISLEIAQKPELLLHKNYKCLDASTVRTLMEVVLKHNNVYFDGKHYLQTNGVAMGTSCACTTTDIYICEWIERHMLNNANLKKPLYYKQYRDDGFGVWTHSLDDLLMLFNHLNSIHPTIQFTLKHGLELEHLDLRIKLTKFGNIATETYYKPTDSFQYLHYSSMHPPHTVDNIPTSQTIRHLRNCSTLSSFKKHRLILFSNMAKRCYPKKLLRRKIFSLAHTDRYKYLVYKRKQKCASTPFVISFNRCNNNRQIQQCLHASFPSHSTQLNTPIMGFRNQQNTGSYLIRAKF